MDRLWRSNSSVSCPPDIVNEEDHTIDDNELILDFHNWNIPKVDTKIVYKTSFVESAFHSAYKARIVEQIFSISKTHEKCCLFTKKNIGEFLASKKFSYLHIGMVQVAIKPLTRKGINASVLMCLRDARFKVFKDSILGMITASLYDGPVYFSCYPDLTLALDDPNIIKALTLNIASLGFTPEEAPSCITKGIYIYIYIYTHQGCESQTELHGLTLLTENHSPKQFFKPRKLSYIPKK